MTPSRFWVELTTVEMAALAPETVALLPVAAVEQHGPHLPLGTDAFINRGIVNRMLEVIPAGIPLLVLPEQTIGASQEHLDFPGSLAHAPPRLLAIWDDVLTCAHRAGVRRFLVFNSHGGQTGLLAPAALDLRVRLGALVAYASWFDAGYPPDLFTDEEIRTGLHGGDIETSLMLHLRSDLVRREQIADFQPATHAIEAETRQLSANPGGGRLGGFGWKAQDLQPSGVTGDASRASVEKGRRLLDYLATCLAELAADLSRVTTIPDSR